MSKSDLFILMAQLPDGDPRLDAVGAVLTGAGKPEAVSFKLWTMGDAAKETTLSRVTLWRAIKEGRLHAVEIRKGSKRIPDADLRRFVGGK
jgi:DNA-binding phage protein